MGVAHKAHYRFRITKWVGPVDLFEVWGEQVSVARKTHRSSALEGKIMRMYMDSSQRPIAVSGLKCGCCSQDTLDFPGLYMWY